MFFFLVTKKFLHNMKKSLLNITAVHKSNPELDLELIFNLDLRKFFSMHIIMYQTYTPN